MVSGTIYESREANIKALPDVVYAFLCDFRNFSHLVPEGLLDGWQAEKGSCRFKLSPLGNASIRIEETRPGQYISYKGALEKISFKIETMLAGKEKGTAMKIRMEAMMDPFLKMIAGPQIEKGLNRLIDEIERFNGWEERA